MESCERDASVDAFCKVNEQKHTFARLRYIKEDGLPAFYSADFLVRAGDSIYLVETKAQNQLTTPNVLRKRKAAVAWCDRINAIAPEQRSNAEWHYVVGPAKRRKAAPVLDFRSTTDGLNSQKLL